MLNDNLQQQLKLMYDYWFTQFDFPDESGKPYKSSGGAMVYNEQLKRQVPVGWHTKRLSEVCTIALGGTPSTDVKSYWNGTINWLNSGEVAQFPVIKSALKITESGLANSPTKLMKKGTTIISITGNIRASVLAIDACANQSVVGIFENNELKYPLIYQFISKMIDRFSTLSTGNCQQHINKGTIEDALITIPTKEILSRYYQLSLPLYNEIMVTAHENEQLIALRDWLLPMLMNGQATISD